ncbi:MAG: metallophosphoesterase [Deltaproteobacteria bacterium]|nr:metallophosphoesterase [Deltaproteobacteria bacterium]
MILIIGDIHGRYKTINEQIIYAEEHCDARVSAVIQLGDFGIYKRSLAQYFNGIPERNFKRPVYVIDGNHEDFVYLDILTEKYKDHFTYLPRCAVNNIKGYNFLSLGGSAYMDPVNTPPGATLNDEDIEKCLSYRPDDVDIIISHDCPLGIGVPGTPGFEYCDPIGFFRSDEIKEHFKPKIWFFAHHHKWFNHDDGKTQYYGLHLALNGFALLDDNYDLKIIKSPLKISSEGKF